MRSLYLVAHLHKAPQGEFEDQTAFEGYKVPHILKKKEPWTIVVAVAQI